MFGVISISSCFSICIYFDCRKKCDVPLFDVFGAGFILMMIELRTIIEDDITYFMVCASIMMAVPVFIFTMGIFL